jgi:hypothetical protein
MCSVGRKCPKNSGMENNVVKVYNTISEKNAASVIKVKGQTPRLTMKSVSNHRKSQSE